MKITPREKRRHAARRECLFSREVIFTRARVSLALLSLRKNGGLLVVYTLVHKLCFSLQGQRCYHNRGKVNVNVGSNKITTVTVEARRLRIRSKTRKPDMFFEAHLLSFKILDRPKKSTKPHPHEEVVSLPLCLRETDRIYIELINNIRY